MKTSCVVPLSRLRAMHKEHVKRKGRREQTAIGPLAAWYLCARAEEMTQTLGALPWILDMGSGFSSIALRYWAQELCRDDEERLVPVVWTTDHLNRWLWTTQYELEIMHLSTEHVMLHEVFLQLLPQMVDGMFDFVFLDLADTRTRLDMVNDVVRWLNPYHGVLLCDDWHLEQYSNAMSLQLQSLGLVCENDNLCKDQFGRVMSEWIVPRKTTS